MKFITRKERSSTRVSLFFFALLPFTFNDGKVEYYDVKVNGTNFEFTKKSGATNPTDKVPSLLKITYTDMYGHQEVANMDAKVLKREVK